MNEMTPEQIHAVIWMGPLPSSPVGFMYQPALKTLELGLKAHGAMVTVGAGLPDLLRNTSAIRTIGHSDIFVWIGVAHSALISGLVGALTAVGVHTVYYRTEQAMAGGNIVPTLEYVVQEVWDYSRSNLAQLGRRWRTESSSASYQKARYLPPGFIPSPRVVAIERSRDARPRLVFLGSGSRHYARYGCLQHILRSLNESRQRESRAVVPPGSARTASAVVGASLRQHPKWPKWQKACFDQTCPVDRCRSAECPLEVVHDAFSSSRWNAEVFRSAYFLNVHKNCNASAAAAALSPVRPPIPCESFRFSTLLSIGASIVSEHCFEEAEYEGLVEFRDLRDIPAAFLQLYSRRKDSSLDAFKRKQAYRQRMDASAILARAGVPQMLASLQRKRASPVPQSQRERHRSRVRSMLDTLIRQHDPTDRCSPPRQRDVNCW